MNHLAAACAAGLAGMALTPAFADVGNINGTVGRSDVVLEFKPGTSSDPGGTSGIRVIEGNVIAGNFGSVDFRSGASYESTSLITPDIIFFKNGNASAGQFVRSVSTTEISISFVNTSNAGVTPFLQSVVVPAAFGIFVGPGTCSGNPTLCNPADPLLGDPARTFSSFNRSGLGPPETSSILASASFTFNIYGNDDLLYSLQSDLALNWGGGGGNLNFISTNIEQAENDLTGWKQASPDGSNDWIGFSWDETILEKSFLSELAPGATGTLRYETIVETTSNSNCFDAPRPGCLVSYSSFGDPPRLVSRPPGARIGGDAGLLQFGRFIGPLSDPVDPPQGLVFGEYRFRAPVFNPATGGLALVLQGNPVPEPDSWALMIAGFGLIGATMRRRRRAAA